MRFNFSKTFIVAVAIVLFFSFVSHARAATYYVDNGGNDTNSGTDTAHPWQTIDKINAMTFTAGDSILFEGGQTFSGSLYLWNGNSSGTSGNPITISSYGTGRATINSGTDTAFYIESTAGMIIQNLILTGTTTPTAGTYGIFAYNNLTGNTAVNYLKFHNLDISHYDIGIMIGANPSDNSSSGFTNVEISNNILHDGLNDGIELYGSNQGHGFAQHTVLIDSNTVYNFVGKPSATTIGGNGILLGQTSGATVQNNVVHDCGQNNTDNSGPVGIWAYDSTNITIQYNEVYNQKTNSNTDGDGFDFDGGTTNSVMQYNYSHNNYGAGFQMYAYSDALITTWNNNTVRYNISENDGTNNTNTSSILIGAKSAMTNAYVYNNTVYNSRAAGSTLGLFGTSIGTMTGTISNNIFYSASGASFINTIGTNPSSVTLAGNDYYNSGTFSIKWGGTTYSTFSAWQTAVGKEKISGSNVAKTTNPLLVSPGTGGTVGGYIPGNLTAYNLQSTSPMIDTGINLSSQFSITAGSQDYYGTTIPQGSGYELGAYEAPVATTFTFTGPTSGNINAASTNFTVTPNNLYTGTITVTPSGGGLSTPIVLTFSNSLVAQTFTITPTATGTVTLTPTNNGSLTNPSNLSYTVNAVAPGAPTSVSATAGNAQATVTFTAPASNGGASITGYTVTSIPAGGTDTNAGTTSLSHVITGLTNNTSYTFTVTATNTAGTSAASSPSNSVTPILPPATTFTLTGPSSGNINTASSNFTVTPNNYYTGTITVTPSGGGLSSPVVLTFSSSNSPQTFTITPTAVGAVTLTPTNNGGLTNPSNLSYTVNAVAPGAPTAVSATAGNAQATVTFSAPASNGGASITGYTVTSIPSGGVDSDAGTTALTHTVTGLTNNTSYTFTVTATNTAGTSAASSPSNSVTPVVPPATTFTFTGPSSGNINVASSNFTVTPNNPYSGTITLTPSGGGLSTPTVLTFSNSATPQTFTITPTSVGTVTLTPTNNGSLTNPSNLSYTVNAVAPSAPTSVTAVAGNAQATVTFSAPASNGGSAITGYTVTSIPGGGTDTNAGTTSLTHTITGLTNNTSYTFTVTATNTVGTSAASSPSNSVTPAIPPATGYTFTGPSTGSINSASTNFTVTPNNPYTGTITLTPSGGGLSTPIILTFSSSSTPQTFTITPTAVGTITLTPTNNGSLTDPSDLLYSVTAIAPGIPTSVSATAGNAQATVTFSAPASNGGATITAYTVTSTPGSFTASGSASPITVTGLSNGTSYTFTVTATNSAGTSSASTASNSVTPTIPPATTFTFTGPASGSINSASTNFTVTPNNPYTGTITLTPSGGGLSTPTVLTFSNSAVAQTFTITPTAVGTVTLTPSNSGSLTNPSNLSYAVNAVIPGAPTSVTAVAGNAQATVTFTAPASNGGSAITGYTVTSTPGNITATGSTSPITVTGLSNGTPYTFVVTSTNSVGTSTTSSASNSVTPIGVVSSAVVTITAPVVSTTVSGTAVPLAASVSGNTGTTSVQFKVDGVDIGSPIASLPYTTTWNSTGVGDGAHTIIATLTDDNGAATSSGVTISVLNNPVVYSGGGGGGGGGSYTYTPPVVTTPTDCTATTRYSALTGAPCPKVTLPSDCLGATAYSALTGQACLNYTGTPTVSTTTTPVTTTQASTISVTAQNLNVRSSPSTGKIIATISLGTIATVLSGSPVPGWIKVELPSGVIGYVSEKYTTTATSPISTSPASTATVRVSIQSGRLVVRSSVGGSIAGYVVNDTVGIVLSTVPSSSGLSWLKVKFPKVTGWVSSYYVK